MHRVTSYKGGFIKDSRKLITYMSIGGKMVNYSVYSMH